MPSLYTAFLVGQVVSERTPVMTHKTATGLSPME